MKARKHTHTHRATETKETVPGTIKLRCRDERRKRRGGEGQNLKFGAIPTVLAQVVSRQYRTTNEPNFSLAFRRAINVRISTDS